MNEPDNKNNTALAEQNKEQREVARLGDGEVFIRRGPNGAIRSVQAHITLTEAKGHITDIEGSKMMYNQEAYEECNKVAGVSIITPKMLTLPEGNSVVNPYPIIDPGSGTIEKVWVKKLAIGYAPMGNMVVTSATLLFDTTAYFLQDIQKKIKGNKECGRVCMRSQLTVEELQKGSFHPIQGELGLYANYNHSDIQKALATFIQNKLFAERKAQTICERLVYSKHPALVLGKPTAKTMKVSVIGWIHDHTADELMDMANQAADANPDESGELNVGGTRIETIDVSREVTDEDITVGTVGEDEYAGSAGDVGRY